MNNKQIQQLNKIKKLVIANKRRFEKRKDRNYIEDLNNLELTQKEAWNHVLTLNENL